MSDFGRAENFPQDFSLKYYKYFADAAASFSGDSRNEIPLADPQADFSPAEIKFMQLALQEAETCLALKEVPVGCVLVKNNEVVGRGHNLKESSQDPTKHAELLAISAASKKLGTWRFDEVDCYVTLEPCHMCASALQQARIRHLYIASLEPKTGAIFSVDNFYAKPFLNHTVEASYGLLAAESSQMLKDFFRQRRKVNKDLENKLGGRGKRRDFRQNN